MAKCPTCGQGFDPDQYQVECDDCILREMRERRPIVPLMSSRPDGQE